MDNFHIGPVGGNGGRPFDNYDIPEDARLTAIHVFTEWVINALQFDFIQTDGTPGGNGLIGGLGGEHHVFYLDEDEFLTGISGRAGWYVDSIRFHTNKRISPTFGGAGGDRDFSFAAPEASEIYGLFGRSGWYIDALGVYTRSHAEVVENDATSDEAESWLALAGEGEALPASVVVRREIVASNEALDELEDAILMEAIAGIGTETEGEGTVDAAIYTQVIDDAESGQTVAVIMAVASEVGAIETVGDEPDEVAVMVTDAIESEDDILLLEEEAVESAIDALLAEMEDETDEVEVTIYTGIDEKEGDDKVYAAVVAIATRLESPVALPSRSIELDDPAEQPRRPRGKGLEIVEGIGPKIAELLISHNIHDLAELASTPVDKLSEILGAAGRRFRLADPTTWPEQAALGAAGMWDKLTELQAQLKGGR